MDQVSDIVGGQARCELNSYISIRKRFVYSLFISSSELTLVVGLVVVWFGLGFLSAYSVDAPSQNLRQNEGSRSEIQSYLSCAKLNIETLPCA